MGASNRLRLLAPAFPPDEARALSESAAVLAEAAQRLARIYRSGAADRDAGRDEP